ncbi:MAG: peptidylprolyl isomerase [Chitinophagaceae bacterium]|nr:MAG: peptidylprolyl isomerase [Chitinophagaceae bacterium]
METFIEIQKTLDYVNGTTTPAPKAPFTHPINWQLVQSIPAGQKVRIITGKGEIVLQLNVNDAPGSVANFVELVRKGFYDGKQIHRVAPNFVVQDGCPRGDGWGSTEYNIRSEFSPNRFSAGAVGLASAGKDTESCQWFITHTATPHLDGRYTNFAQVLKGMDVVHRLGIGDKIESVVMY